MEMHARLKLEVPVPSSNSKDVVPAPHIDAQIKLLKEVICFKKFDIDFDDGVQTEVDEPGCEKFVEVHYEIACMKFSTSLIPSLRTFLFNLISNMFPHHMKGIVIVNSPECFSNQLMRRQSFLVCRIEEDIINALHNYNKCFIVNVVVYVCKSKIFDKECHNYSSAHLEKPVKALYFGNIQGGVLLSHWEVTVSQVFYEFVSYRNNHKSDDITVDFEYDNNDIIAIRFKNKEEGKELLITFWWYIIIFYSFISITNIFYALMSIYLPLTHIKLYLWLQYFKNVSFCHTTQKEANRFYCYCIYIYLMKYLEPTLDEIRIWAENNKIPRPSGMHGNWAVQCMFRPSQNKYIFTIKIEYTIIIVSRISFVVTGYFLAAFINLHFKCGIFCNDIKISLNLDCRNRLKELPRRIDVDLLSVRAGFQLSAEPFFRSLIKASVKFSITKQLRKEQIQIPFEKGRSMLGVVDETGRLQYGQIFVQYTRNIRCKVPPENSIICLDLISSLIGLRV
uniref:RNA-dependent RNA polymerase n=1 Tax=Heterorhabditis bacteriophora TaxID=37862 RepID=A0A1I7WEB3_HETBA